MLQVRSAGPNSQGGGSAFNQQWAAPDVSSSVSLRQTIDNALGFLRRRYLTIGICLTLSIGLAVAYLSTTPKSYSASAVMMIDGRRGQGSPFGELLPDAAWIDSQIGILKSESVAGYVVKQLKLADDVEFLRPDLGLFGRVKDAISSRLGLEQADPKSEAERVALATALVRSRIEAKRLGSSYLIRTEVSSNSADQAAKIANSMVDAYILDQLNAKFQANRRSGDWLQERLQSLREQTAAAERAVLEFKVKNNIVAVDGKLLSDKVVVDLGGQMAAARVRATDAQARLNRIQAIISGEQPDITSEATVSDAMNNSIVTGLRSRYLDLASKESTWANRYGNNHTAVTNIRNQMREIRTSMIAELKRIAETYKSEYEIAINLQNDLQPKLNALMAESEKTSQSQIALYMLEVTAQSYRKLHDNFLQRQLESTQQQSFPSTEARLISPASVAQTFPSASQVWIIALMGGCVLGFGLAGLRELMDRVFRTSDQVKSVLDTECLALLPLLKNQRALTAKRSKLNAPDLRNISNGAKILRSVIDAPFSQYTEAVRGIKLSADRMPEGRRSKTIGLISALPGEGKSTAAMALAQIATQGRSRVLLVDCDIRNPSLTQMLAPDAKAGLVDVALGGATLDEAIWKDPTTGLEFLPTVENQWVHCSAEFLSLEVTRKLFETFRAEYDYVIVDLPPLVPVVDVRATCGLVNAYVLLIEWGQTKIEVVQRALANAREVQENILGVVLNKVDMDTIGRYDRYGRSHFDYNYGSNMYRTGSVTRRH